MHSLSTRRAHAVCECLLFINAYHIIIIIRYICNYRPMYIVFADDSLIRNHFLFYISLSVEYVWMQTHWWRTATTCTMYPTYDLYLRYTINLQSAAKIENISFRSVCDQVWFDRACYGLDVFHFGIPLVPVRWSTMRHILISSYLLAIWTSAKHYITFWFFNISNSF